jgi:putative SOS response-associated peptidase YedK
MCGRFARIVSDKTLREKYRLERLAKLQDGYNIAPQQPIGAVRAANDGNELVLLKWGLIPSWSNDAKIAYKLTNARAETVAEKPSFRSAFKQRRCIIPASGFYEWKREGKQKQPFYIHPRDDGIFSFAGLWETWHDPEGEIVESCAVITTEANELMRTIHDRMPVILDWQGESAWLDRQTPVEDLRSLLAPLASEKMQAYTVDPYVNNAKNQGAKCIEPMAA